jgi:CheY-like chemotaxis protein
MSPVRRDRPFEILLVEDNPGDVRLAMEALQEGVVRKNVHVAEDGVAAIEYLQRLSIAGRGALPDLVLLDLNLPKRNGHEVLAEIRRDVQLRRIPVVVFTSSAAAPDVHQAYDLHANCYVTKPPGFAELVETIKRIEIFWLTVATLPSQPSGD